MRFRDRAQAGQLLAAELEEYSGRDDVVVLALPRGGVPVALEVARGLGAPLDVFPVRKLGVPGHEELAVGAIGPGGVRVTNPLVVVEARIGRDELDAIAEVEARELERQERLYRGGRPPLELAGRTAILVDDGLATGASMRAAALAASAGLPREVVVAVPVAAESTARELSREVDRVVCVLMPPRFLAVGAWYEDFGPVGDDEVRRLLEAGESDSGQTR
jgi:predicted phosphoribosyltransferase